MTPPAWLKNGSGWFKVGILALGILVGYAMRLERDSQRISVIEKWISGQETVTMTLRDRMRVSEANISSLTAGQTATAANIANIYMDVREIRAMLVRGGVSTTSNSGGTR